MASKAPLVLFLFLFFKYSDCLGFTTRLIHYDSIFSPFYNASETTADRASRAARSSLARAAYLSLRGSPAGIRAKLVEATSHNAFFVNFSIGSHRVPQLAIMDTGSDFLWVKCLPCTPCSPTKGVTYYDPSQSWSYSPLPCSELCKRFCQAGRWPWSPRHCKYRIDYVGGYQSEGIYAREQLTFRTSDDKTTTVFDIQFGCGSKLTGTKWHTEGFNGVFGLGTGHPDSLLTQPSFFDKFHRKFSYCIGHLDDPAFTDHQLSFGDAAQLVGDPTPFYYYDFKYNVHLVNISLGTKMLDIHSRVFDSMQWKKRVVIDSGITLLHLYSEVYEVVMAELGKVGSDMLKKVPPTMSPYKLCYDGHIDLDPIGFPTLELHLAGDAVLAMETRSIFRQVNDDTFCVAIVESDSITYIGIMAQQGYNVGFDLVANNMHLELVADCNFL